MAEAEGWVYVLKNEAMPGLVKIGYTMKDPAIRAEDLSKETGIPMPFVVIYKALVVSPHDVEQEVHADLKNDRVNNQREFFRCDPFDAIECIRANAEIKYEVCDEEYEEYEEGTINYKGGSTYIGEYKTLYDGTKVRHGQGTWTTSDGILYKGEWKNNKRHGQGTFAYSDGELIYEGEWKDDKRHGHGHATETHSDGSVAYYKGEWQANEKHGHGIMTYAEGAVYKGEWQNNVYHGQGTLAWPNGEKYVGEWKDGKKHGKGVNEAKGLKRSGEWKNDKMHGRILTTFPDGKVFPSVFLHGKAIGYRLHQRPDYVPDDDITPEQ